MAEGGGGDMGIKMKSPSVQQAWVLSRHQHLRPTLDSTRRQASETHGDPTAQTIHVWVCLQVCARHGTCTGLQGHLPERLNTFGPVVLPVTHLPLKKEPKASVIKKGDRLNHEQNLSGLWLN